MKTAFSILIAVSCLGLSACREQGFVGPRGELHSDSPGFERVTRDGRDDDAPELPSGDVSDDPPEDLPENPPENPIDDSGTTGPTTGADPVDPGPQEEPLPTGADPFADRVVSYHLGSGGGLHEADLPGIVLGAPRGYGLYQGSFHVLSLGVGGDIVLEMTDYAIFDGTGDDFTVSENAFLVSGSAGVTFAEPGIVGVSEDGVTFVDFPCDLSDWPYAGCAGVEPVLSNADTNGIDATNPEVSGGDPFDLHDVGLKTARFIRIRDSGLGLGPIGPNTRGFDFDAVAIIHGTLPE